MHVHASYSINLAEMGSNRDEIQEIAVRRAAEVRRRLAALAMTAHHDDDEVVLVKAVAAPDSDLPVDAYSTTEAEPVPASQLESESVAHRDPSDARNLFSAVA